MPCRLTDDLGHPRPYDHLAAADDHSGSRACTPPGSEACTQTRTRTPTRAGAGARGPTS
jgi:hypothetical protein